MVYKKVKIKFNDYSLNQMDIVNRIICRKLDIDVIIHILGFKNIENNQFEKIIYICYIKIFENYLMRLMLYIYQDIQLLNA